MKKAAISGLAALAAIAIGCAGQVGDDDGEIGATASALEGSETSGTPVVKLRIGGSTEPVRTGLLLTNDLAIVNINFFGATTKASDISFPDNGAVGLDLNFNRSLGFVAVRLSKPVVILGKTNTFDQPIAAAMPAANAQVRCVGFSSTNAPSSGTDGVRTITVKRVSDPTATSFSLVRDVDLGKISVQDMGAPCLSANGTVLEVAGIVSNAPIPGRSENPLMVTVRSGNDMLVWLAAMKRLSFSRRDGMGGRPISLALPTVGTTRMCMQVKDESLAMGASIVQRPCDPTKQSQRFWRIEFTTGHVALVSDLSGFCVNVLSTSFLAPVPAFQLACTFSSEQKLKLTPWTSLVPAPFWVSDPNTVAIQPSLPVTGHCLGAAQAFTDEAPIITKSCSIFDPVRFDQGWTVLPR